MSEEMREFLQAWLDWAKSGAHEGAPFFRADGLCLARCVWGKPYCFNNRKLYAELNEMLERDFGTSTYPFGRTAYLSAAHNKTQHEDPARLEWVRKCLKN